MSKKIITLALAAMFALSAGTAMAMPLDFTGDFRLQGRVYDDTTSGNGAVTDKRSFFQFRARLMFNGQLDKDTAFFGRISNRSNFGSPALSANDSTKTTEFDWYGIKGKLDDWNYSLGRQAVTLGQGSILGTGADASGVTNRFDGVILTKKLGDYNVNVIGGKTMNVLTYIPDSGAAQWYGFDVSKQLSKKVQAGFAFASAKQDNAATDSRKYFSVNTNIQATPNIGISGEYTRSNADTNNAAYFVASTYSWDKNSFTVQYNNVENNSVDKVAGNISPYAYSYSTNNLWTGDTKYSGFTYAYNRTIRDNLSFHAVYMNLKADGRTGADKNFASGLVWSF
ncbi:hypothetical protein [Sporomusa sp.]|uniref:hypothetical protein n=1 Tax=Sporomusa sp. TaxID=2078658 RepID=UPI002BA7DF26|nr:hypothetical protein [Sporomusa sp.]HWR43487.1 hypothetical protein [Sporomusa sp.]